MTRAGSRGRTSFVEPTSDDTDSFRELRLALELRRESRTGNTVMFTSPGSGDGKSTLAANYALVAAADGLNVLLIDADIRSPRLHEFFDVPRAPGLVDLLGSHSELEKFIHHQVFIGDGQLSVLTAGTAVRSFGHLASSNAMAWLLEGARSHADVVVVDSPPALVSADASGLASHRGNDVVVVVRRSGRRRPLTRTLRKLELVGANVAGLVINGGERQSPYG